MLAVVNRSDRKVTGAGGRLKQRGATDREDAHRGVESKSRRSGRQRRRWRRRGLTRGAGIARRRCAGEAPPAGQQRLGHERFADAALFAGPKRKIDGIHRTRPDQQERERAHLAARAAAAAPPCARIGHMYNIRYKIGTKHNRSNPSLQSGMVQPVVNEMFATVHAAGSSLLGLFTSCTTFDSTERCAVFGADCGPHHTTHTPTPSPFFSSTLLNREG
eukprot:scaffold1151_cov126-Isochrysis_galbana.AAC.14